jgi:hypothetical protein
MTREITVWAIIDKDGDPSKMNPFGEFPGLYEIHESFSSAVADLMVDEMVVEAKLTWKENK